MQPRVENSEDPAKDPSPESLKTFYDQVCLSYRAIDDFRAKLLGFLPLATGEEGASRSFAVVLNRGTRSSEQGKVLMEAVQSGQAPAAEPADQA